MLACEMDEDARKVYEHSFPSVNGHTYEFPRNIRALTRTDIKSPIKLKTRAQVSDAVPDHDMLCGGFPCQPFSKSGAQHGALDKTRGTLFHDILQIVEAKHPKYIFLENVRNIAGPRHTETWNTVISSIRSLGYFVNGEPLIFSPHLLPPEMGGAPQVRERVFILAVRKDIGDGPLVRILEFNRHLRSRILWNPDQWRISEYLDEDQNVSNIESYFLSPTESTYIQAWNHFVKGIKSEQLPAFPLWAFAFTRKPSLKRGMPSWEINFRQKNSAFYNSHRDFIDRWMHRTWGRSKIPVTEFPISRQKLEWQVGSYCSSRTRRRLDDLVLQFRPSGIRVKPPTYLPALVAITQTSILGPRLRSAASRQYRRLTPTEAARLQSLPDNVYSEVNVSAGAAYKQLGNAVNVGIVKKVAQTLLDHGNVRDSGRL